MTVSAQTIKYSYDGNDSTDEFAYSCYIAATSDLIVVITSITGVDTTQTETTHYTVAGAGDASGGTVTMLTPPATGETLTIYRDTPMTQTVNLENQGAWDAEAIEAALDKPIRICQELQEEVTRCDPNGISATYLPLAGGAGNAMTDDLYMGTNQIKSVVDPSSDQDAATKKYVDDECDSHISTANDTSTGHDHDGSDSKKVLQSDTLSTGLIIGDIPVSDGSDGWVSRRAAWGGGALTATTAATAALTTSYANVETTIFSPVSATQEALVFIGFTFLGDNAATCQYKLLRDSTELIAEVSIPLITDGSANAYGQVSMVYKDTPGQTGSVTYKLAIKAAAGTTMNVYNTYIDYIGLANTS